MNIRYFLLGAFSLLLVISACKHNPPYTVVPGNIEDGDYPPEIAKIMVNKCATAGCHNQASYTAAGGLLLDKWGNLFNGGNNGAAIVPYSTEFSPLLYFINNDSSLGVVSEPRMPHNGEPLSRDEYLLIRDWIAKGAPSKDGTIPFSSNPDTRQKIYLTQQGCDLLAVIDAEKKVVMRYIKIGGDDAVIESPHSVKVSSDGKYAYVCFSQGRYLQKIETATDKVVGQVALSPSVGQWNALVLSPDSKKALVTNLVPNPNGMVLVDVENMRFERAYPQLTDPHGVATNADFDTFYVTKQTGNIVYKYPKDAFQPIILSIDNNAPDGQTSSRDPHEILMSPDYSKYYLTCQKSNEIRILDAKTNEIKKVLNVGEFPQEMVFSKKYPYLFVSCKLGDSPFSTTVKYAGSVYVINYQTDEIVKRIDHTFTQPHGVTVDDKNDALYVASINPTGAGPAPHHVSSCAGKNGYYQIFDLKTLMKMERTNSKYEVTVAPYSSAIRFE